MDKRAVTFASGREYTLDRYGFLDPPRQWNEEFAEGMAKTQGIHDGLTEAHWELIRYLRKKFIVDGTVPLIVTACAENSLRLGRLQQLFPTGYHRGACRIAGINYAFLSNDNIWHTYESYRVLATEYNMTPGGFLVDFATWNRRFAHVVAEDWDLPDGLTGRHWEIINYLRDAHRATKSIPSVFETCKANGLDLDELAHLFPEGYLRGACRAAGLPFIA